MASSRLPLRVCLPERVARGVAEDMLFSGRSLSGQEAFELGLVTGLDKDPVDAAFTYYETHLAPLSASSLRRAVDGCAPRSRGAP